jgi:hypothetical protein
MVCFECISLVLFRRNASFFCEIRSLNAPCIMLNIHMGEVKADTYQWHHALSVVIGSAWCCTVRRHRNSRTGFRNKCSTLSAVGTVPAPSAVRSSPSTFINCGARSFLLLHATVWDSLRYNGWAVTIRTYGFLNFLDSAQVQLIPGSYSPLSLFHYVLCNAAIKMGSG